VGAANRRCRPSIGRQFWPAAGGAQKCAGRYHLQCTHQWRGATRRWARPGLCHGVADVRQATRGLSRRAGSPARACPDGHAGRTNGSDSSATTGYTRGTCARRTWCSWCTRQLLIEFGPRHLVKCDALQRGISPSTIHGGSWETVCAGLRPGSQRILPHTRCWQITVSTVHRYTCKALVRKQHTGPSCLPCAAAIIWQTDAPGSLNDPAAEDGGSANITGARRCVRRVQENTSASMAVSGTSAPSVQGHRASASTNPGSQSVLPAQEPAQYARSVVDDGAANTSSATGGE
jgi:hypothetical protein